MTISRVNAATWSVGEKLTSAQANGLDLNTTYALDKRAGQTDTLSSGITVASGASLTHASGSTSTHQSGSTLTISSGCVVTATLNGASQIVLGASGAKVDANASGAVVRASASGAQIQATTTGAKIITSGGGTFEIGGATAFPDFTTSRTRSVCQHMVPLSSFQTGWSPFTHSSSGQSGYIEKTAISSQYQDLLIVAPHNGATLSTVKMYIKVVGPHAGVPATLPAMQVVRRKLSDGAEATLAGLFASFPVPGSAAAWDNGSTIQSWTFTATQNNVIDTSLYIYFIQLLDEAGANSVAGNLYVGYEMGYSAITTMQFP